jgi:hypothetical protein
MEKRNLIIIFVVLTSISSFCQNFTDKFLNELKQKEVDTICVFEDYSIGSVQVFDKDTENDYCEFEFENIPTYIFWKQNGKTFLTKKDNCFEYSTTEIDADKVCKNYFDNKKAIKIEKVKNFQFVEIKNGKRTILNSMIDHSHHRNFKIVVKDKITEKRFDDFDLQKFDGNEKEININYKHNMSLKSKTLVDEIGNLIMKNERLLTKKKIGM